MAVECLSFRGRRPGLRRSNSGGLRAGRISFLSYAIAFGLALAAALASGQDAVNLPVRQVGPVSLPPVVEVNGMLSGSVTPEASLSFEADRASFSPSPSGTPRNRAMEIVQRRDDYAVRRYRRGFFQRLRISGGWIDSAANHALEIGEFKTSLTVALPLGSFENLLIVTSGFEVESLTRSPSGESPSP